MALKIRETDFDLPCPEVAQRLLQILSRTSGGTHIGRDKSCLSPAERLFAREWRLSGVLKHYSDRQLMADSVEKLQIAFTPNSREGALQSTIHSMNRRSAC